MLADSEFEASHGARPGVAEPIVIVFTDGYSQQDPQPGPVSALPFLFVFASRSMTIWSDTLGATKLHDKKVTAYAVGIVETYPVNLHELEVK